MVDHLSSVPVDAPFGSEAVAWAGFSWEEARCAIEGQERGHFWLAAQLGLQSKRYAPVRAAARVRRALPEGLPWSVPGPERRPGLLETEAARALWELQIERLLTSMLDDIAFHGFSVLQHPTDVDADGRRYVTGVERWPIGATGYTSIVLEGTLGPVIGYYAIDREGNYHQLPRPGETDGFWTVVAKGDRPHLDGAVTSLDVQYVAGAISERARANLIATAGRVAPVIDMPESVQAGGPEDAAAQKVVAGIGVSKAGAVLFGGAKLDKFELGSQTYTFFADALRDRIAMIELALLNRAGVTTKESAQYTAATGIEMSVPEDLIRADVRKIEGSIGSLFALLARLNQDLPPGRAPKLSGNMPDTDQAAKRAAEQAERKADDEHRVAQLAAGKLAAEQLAAERDAGMLVDAARIATVYALAGIDPPVLKPLAPAPAAPQNAPPPAATSPGPQAPAGALSAP